MKAGDRIKLSDEARKLAEDHMLSADAVLTSMQDLSNIRYKHMCRMWEAIKSEIGDFKDLDLDGIYLRKTGEVLVVKGSKSQVVHDADEMDD
jgi:hypothetical protein